MVLPISTTLHRVWNTLSQKKLFNKTAAKLLSLKNLNCEPTVPPLEHLLDSVIKTYYKLQELGIQEINGKIICLTYFGIF